ncbi:aminodeoxychorismate synthase component I [Microbacterium sp. SLBN-146]|uniref:aminodeoxychorismate synthase component I n=1 Tax=Microbacterium sp. SLBN-146 TaxID=2768457 RepID=UPI0011540C9D|nr:aminodeoxychorismate synthase component I [Microbacterium sp. SLBN-146]TQJ32059.1 anthranilate synthase component 1 [Microbacterium sp. SLBN-146]
MTEDLISTPLGAWMDPQVVFHALHARSAHAFWLDAGPDAVHGWSWVGIGVPEPDPHQVRAVPCAAAASDGGAGPFRGGWVGWLDYEQAAARAGAPVAASDAFVPSVSWLRVTRFVAFDHERRRAWHFGGAGESIDVDAAEPAPAPVEPDSAPSPARGRHDPDDYAALVERCRDAIREGDAYQLCLTTRFAVEGDIDPVEAYRRLRATTPAHHGGLIVSGDVAVVSASPERFLDVRSGVVRTHPIKGTRPRGRDEEEDLALAHELQSSAKERAENIMIVDLMRNDLSRVCRAGTIRVESLLAVESYPAVHQLVSTVAGDLLPGTTVGDLLDAAFPAGSMTGAPKLSAMTILHDLEGAPRGIFSGAFGWVGTDGALDLAMVIRTIVTHPGGAYVGAGGGITWHSDAAAEVAEVGVKARGPLAAIGATLPLGW